MKNVGLAFLVTIFGCSSVETYNRTASFSDFEEGGPYVVKVRTPDVSLSRYTYETAFNKFGQVLDIVENENDSGAIEITFASQKQSAYVASSSTSGSTSYYGNVWYSSPNYANYSGTSYTNTTSTYSGGSIDWQNSNMLITIKDKFGKRLWSADYTYKGGWEMSGFSVNTPLEASKLCIERLLKTFKSDTKFSGNKQVKNSSVKTDNTLAPLESNVSKAANVNTSQLRTVNAQDKNDCEFVKSITRGAGGIGDVSKFIERAMNSALTEAAKIGADSYFVVDADATNTGASVVLEAFRCY